MKKSRERKYQELIDLIKLSEQTTILDIGVADKEYSPFDNYFEKKFPYPDKVTALSILELNEFSKKYPKIKPVYYGGRIFPFKDQSFSVVISNAVIEHVGGLAEQTFFINEMIRVGQKIYFTTPAKEFPIEIHTNYPLVHWLPKKTFDKILIKIGKGWASGNYMNLLTKKNLQTILDNSTAETYKIFTHYLGPFPLHYTVIIPS
jgi:hypothetical protein